VNEVVINCCWERLRSRRLSAMDLGSRRYRDEIFRGEVRRRLHVYHNDLPPTTIIAYMTNGRAGVGRDVVLCRRLSTRGSILSLALSSGKNILGLSFVTAHGKTAGRGSQLCNKVVLRVWHVPGQLGR